MVEAPDAVSCGVKTELAAGSGARLEVDKDFLCPICIQTMRDAFLTSCGHSFCYMCIMTHLNNKNTCPCCGVYLTSSQLYPNFVLNKILKKAVVCHLANKASPTEYLRLALKQGADMSLKEIDYLLYQLNEKKQRIEQEEAEANMEILLEFLYRSRNQKQQELNEIETDLQCLKDDIAAVENQIMDLKTEKGHLSSKEELPMPFRFLTTSKVRVKGSLTSGELVKPAKSLSGKRTRSAESVEAGVVISKKRKVAMQFEELQECYLQKRRQALDPNASISTCSSYGAGLEEFQSVLAAFTRYSELQVVAELRTPDLFHSSNVVSSIEFDRDDEFFATAGVSRRIKVFEYASVTNESVVHYPVMEMISRAKLSCLSWNKYVKHHIASSDYEGIVTVWDANTAQSVMEYEEHEKRAWSVDFSRTDPHMLISGSDDGKAKVWSTKQEKSVLGIEMKANICCVKYNPSSSNFVAVGSADHNIHYYDLRKAQSPVYTFSGHGKTVSYVKFISPDELASASTDSTLRIWNVRNNTLSRVLTGHTNDRNFVGLSVNDEYLACGSETNEVYVYHKAIPRPATSHRFVSADDSDDYYTSHFISAVCWKSDSLTMLGASSQGTIKVLSMAP